MALDLDGKIVIVTGGNTGIGRATSFQLASENATVIIASRTESTCREACEEITLKTGNEKVFYKHLDWRPLLQSKSLLQKSWQSILTLTS